MMLFQRNYGAGPIELPGTHDQARQARIIAIITLQEQLVKSSFVRFSEQPRELTTV
jgi:hypothetical protein